MLTLAAALTALSVAIAGEDQKDIEITEAWRPRANGVVVHVGAWTAGRGHRPGERPSLSPAGDGRPWTYHAPSPEIPWALFVLHLSQAADRSPEEWAAACDVGAAFCSWVSALPADELALAHAQALYWLRSR